MGKQNIGVKHTFWSALLAMRLHSNVSIQMIKCAVGLLAAIPSALVHALNLLITSPGTLVLLRTGNRDEGIDLG